MQEAHREDAAPGGIGEGGELLVHLELPLCGVFQRLIALAVPLEECQIPFRDVPVQRFAPLQTRTCA